MEFKIMMKRLHLPLNQESFNKVECGEQTEVYITFNTYWYNKIEPLIHEDSIVVFSYGYENRPRKPTGFRRGMNWTANHIHTKIMKIFGYFKCKH